MKGTKCNYRYFRAGLLTLGLSSGMGLAAHAATDINEQFDVKPAGRVEIDNVAGEISVIGWDRSEVVIRGSLGRNAKLELNQSRSHLSIKVVKSKNGRMGGTELLVSLPRSSRLSVYGVSTDIKVRGVSGDQRLEAVSGDIETAPEGGDLKVKSVSGSVHVNGGNHQSLITLVSVSGDCELHGIAGELEATSISGDLSVRAEGLARTRLKSTSGDIDIESTMTTGGWFDAETISGDIDIRLEGGADLSVDIETFSGDIDNCMGLDSERKSRYGPGRLLQFERGNADQSLRVQALSGDVDLCVD